jgi:threonine/homoserine/homoserine lactone efflux protein
VEGRARSLSVPALAMLVPGPDTFVVLRTSLADGPRAGTWAAARRWLSAARGESLAADGARQDHLSSSAAFRRGLVSDLLNVKVGLFWTALMPQFVTSGSSALLPPAMVLAMASMVFGWLTAYAYLAARMSRTLRRRGSSMAVNGTVGAVLVALGARLGLAHP